MKIMLIETVLKWRSLLDKAEDFLSGDEDFDSVLFALAMRETYDIFSQLNIKDSVKTDATPDEIGLRDAMLLGGVLHEYTVERTDDKSENRIFSASQCAVRMLLKMVTGDFFWQDSGILSTIYLDIPSDTDQEYIYDVNIGSLEDMIMFIAENERWW